jgi:hypothetical protein
MPHRNAARASFGKRLLATSSVLAIAAGISAAAHAAEITNPNPIPNPTVNTGQTVTAIIFNDGAAHTGSVVNRFGTNTGLIGIGITQEASADVKIFVNYDAQIQNSFASHTISAGLRVRF